MLIEVLVDGLVRSGVYAMLALGFALVFGVGRVLNLAHTAFFMVASYGIFHFVSSGMPMTPAVTLSALGVVALGVLLFRLFIEPVRQLESAVLISSLAVAVLLQELMVLFFGRQYGRVPEAFPGFTRFFGVRVGNQELATVGLALVCLLATWLLLSRTRLGLAIRTAAQDPEVATLAGINVTRVTRIVVGLGILLAALAGAAVAPLMTVEPHLWMDRLVIVLAAVVLGGLGSLKGSVLGAVILAFAETAVVFLVPGGSYLRTAVAMTIMLAVFLLRPEGLFGSRLAEEA